MRIMVYSLFWVMQDLYHQPYIIACLAEHGVGGVPNLTDEMTPKSRGPIPLYYESLYDI